jgi:transcriptional regulator with XRE-family HTH domain
MQRGTILKKIREKRGYSQEVMAHLLGISQSNYNKIESDKIRHLKYEIICKIMESLDLDKEEIKVLMPEFVNLHIENNHINTTSGVHSNKENPELWQALLKSKEAELEAERRLLAQKEREIIRLEKELASLKEEIAYMQMQVEKQFQVIEH